VAIPLGHTDLLCRQVQGVIPLSHALEQVLKSHGHFPALTIGAPWAITLLHHHSGITRMLVKIGVIPFGGGLPISVHEVAIQEDRLALADKAVPEVHSISVLWLEIVHH